MVEVDDGRHPTIQHYDVGRMEVAVEPLRWSAPLRHVERLLPDPEQRRSVDGSAAEQADGGPDLAVAARDPDASKGVLWSGVMNLLQRVQELREVSCRFREIGLRFERGNLACEG